MSVGCVTEQTKWVILHELLRAVDVFVAQLKLGLHAYIFFFTGSKTPLSPGL
jgi:hypothetical protein